MSELLTRTRGEVRDRLNELRPAVEESMRLQAALDALGDVAPRGGASATGSAEASIKPRAARQARRSGAKRAPRGANREAALRVIAERPGISVSELAAASGIKRAVLYALLARLVEQGEVVKENLPSKSTGYSPPRPQSVAAPEAAAAPS